MNDGSSSKTNQKTDWAEERTDWAEDRTLLASERTFAGWLRTGMAAIAVAIGMKAVFGATHPTWAAKAVATVFLIVAAVLFWQARRKALATRERLSRNAAQPLPRRSVTWTTWLLLLGTAATGLVLWTV